ncbi:MAG: HDIG domain-containing protein [Smithellaceae bacterium]|nr:HDIG domain-containing protein [Smithellaceae bacterium]
MKKEKISKRIQHRIGSSSRRKGISTEEYEQIIKPLLDTPEVKRLAEFRHHHSKNRLEHSLEVAWLSYVVAKKMELDQHACVRGALLHDLFFYNWIQDKAKWHGFRHPNTSLENARRITDLSPVERDIIKKHMWPLTFTPPRYRESWLVCLADTFCGIRDCIILLRSVHANN